jgi:ABC-type lipoprotein export system ATPase subunit
VRLQQVGFVFQQSNLLPHLTARENVALPAWHLRGDRRQALALADGLLERLRLGRRATARAAELSLGEAQRVAIARALVNRPTLVLADEPTGSLDSDAAEAVMQALEEITRTGTALLVATHDLQVARRLHRVLRMSDGVLRAAGGA